MMQKIRKKLPELLVILLCMVILGMGVGRKEGFHMDELLSFELANAEFNPWIVPTQPEGRLAKFVHNEIDGETLGESLGNLVNVVTDVLQNRGSSLLLSYQADVYEEPTWITAKQFQDYITVDGGDDFNYLSVYFNVKDDNHPPIHFTLLHTISSLFRGAVKPFMGCVINMAAVAVSMVLLMELGKLLAGALGMEEHGRLLGLFAALLYGISTGALASVLLIRMYCVMTCFCVASFYYHIKKWQTGGFCSKNKGLIAVTVLGFLTQYFFLFYCILLAAVTAVLLWLHNRKKELGIYIRSMLCAAVIGVVCYPFSILHVFSSGRGVEALENLSSGLAGYGSRLAAFGGILADRTFGNLLSVLILMAAAVLCFVVARRSNWGAVMEKIAEKQQESMEKTVAGQVSGNTVGASLVLLLIPATGYFLLAARMSPYQVDRYIMAVFPFVILTGALVLVGVASLLEAHVGKDGKGKPVECHGAKKTASMKIVPLTCVAIVVWQMLGLTSYDGSYLYEGYAAQEQLAAKYGQYPCICVYEGVGYYENLLEFAHYERTLLVTMDELANRQETASISELNSVVVLAKEVDERKLEQVFSEKYGLLLKEELLSAGVHGDRVYLFAREASKESK